MKTLSLNILDIVQNSIRAKADKIAVTIYESLPDDRYKITVSDNGNGIPAEIMKNVTDPFVTTRTKRRMGLGLALLKYHAELAGGSLEIDSGSGTKVIASFSCSHIDRQPLGDIAGVLIILIASNPAIDFTYLHCTDKGKYVFNTRETKEYLETDTLNDRVLLEAIKAMINDNLKNIGASGLQFESDS